MNVTDEYGNTALHNAVISGDIALTRCLISEGAIIDIGNQNGQTPLMSALIKDCPVLADMLLDAGADIDVVDIHNNTPLHYAAMNCREYLVEKIINKGANLDKKNEDGNTPLLLALLALVKDGKTDVATYLISRGTDVNISNNIGQTASQLAVMYYQDHIWDLLKTDEWKVNSTVDKGNAASNVALNCKHIQSLLLLGKVEKDLQNRVQTLPPEAIPLQALGINCGLINYFIHREINVPVHIEKEPGDTPLHIAVRCRNVNYTDLLLVLQQVDVNAQNEKGDTPLHLAVSQNSMKLLTLLLFKGRELNINIQNNIGNTPLHNAVIFPSSNHRIITWLLDNGARVDVKNKGNYTPYCIVRDSGIRRSLIVIHIIKLIIANLPLDLDIALIAKKFKKSKYEHMQVRCLTEIEVIKSTKINEMQSLDILFAKVKKPSYLSSSEESLKHILNSYDFGEKFPLYGTLLKIAFRNAQKRYQLLNSALLMLNSTDSCLQRLPCLAKEKLLRFLGDDDLERLIKSG